MCGKGEGNPQNFGGPIWPLVKYGDMIHRVENPRNEHFDSISEDTNPDKMNIYEDDKVQSDGEEDGEVRELEKLDTITK